MCVLSHTCFGGCIRVLLHPRRIKTGILLAKTSLHDTTPDGNFMEPERQQATCDVNQQLVVVREKKPMGWDVKPHNTLHCSLDSVETDNKEAGSVCVEVMSPRAGPWSQQALLHSTM